MELKDIPMVALELRKQRDAKIQEMHDLTSKTSFPKEAQERWNALDKEQDDMLKQIEAVEKTETMYAEQRQHVAPPAGQVGDAQTREAKSEDLNKRAFSTYIRGGERAIEHAEKEVRDAYSALSTSTSGDAGGVTVPIGFQRELEIKKKAFGGMLAVCRELPTGIGNTINWPTMDDTSNEGEYLGENAAVHQQNPQFGNVQLFSNLCSSKQVLISVQLANDSAFDMESEIRDAFAIRLARQQNRKFTSGSGTGEPLGILTALGHDNDVTAVGDPQTGNDDQNSVGVDDLDNVQMAVNAAYRENGKYMFADSTLKLLKKLKDSLGRPLWVSNLTQAAPDTIYGKPYVVNYNMPELPATDSPVVGVQSVIFGDFSKYIIRKVGGTTVVRYNELYMPNHQIGFQAYERNDGRLIQKAAFAVLFHGTD